jgi:hypothetical protein
MSQIRELVSYAEDILGCELNKSQKNMLERLHDGTTMFVAHRNGYTTMKNVYIKWLKHKEGVQ